MTLQAKAIYPSQYQFKVNTSQLSRADTYQIFESRLHQVAFKILSIFWKPSEWAGYFAARIIEPFPGENKGNILWTSLGRIYALALTLITGSLAIALLPLVLPPHLYLHSKRNVIQFIAPTNKIMNEPGPIHLRSHNIAYGPESFVALTDLRPNQDRAQELVNSILQDNQAPQFLVFQEAYNQIETLTQLKQKYPYIIHSIAPDAFGLSSGFFVASQYPIQDVEFRSYDMEYPEKFIARGGLKVTVETGNGPLAIYSAHLQALLGKERADRRHEQLTKIKQWMETDFNNHPTPQILMGDLNTSYRTFLGENNNLEGQPEKKVIDFINHHFYDCFGEDHDSETGERKKNNPLFLKSDNERMRTPHLPEPKGSLVFGPFAIPGYALTRRMKQDSLKFNYTEAPIVEPIDLKKLHWGTPHWHDNQMENPARLDHALIPLQVKPLFQNVQAEIRRIPTPNNKSAVSDHLPLDVVLEIGSSSS